MNLSPQWLDELRSRTTLSALIGRTIKVTRAGREYKACCPFHNEKTPSFTINDEKGFYHCFGCSAHGDAIRWMTDQRGLGFMDAVKELAAQAGMEVPAPDPRAAKKAEQRAGLHDVMQAAQDWFVQQLASIEGSVARSYLEKRGIKTQTVHDFGIGFAPDSRNGLKDALAHFGNDLLIEAGLLIKVDGKEPYDRFRGRLMIPIRDPRGRVIAFGGRILGEGEPKYLNSPDTPLFDKGSTLYNLDICSPASRSSNRVIVAEGYMDVIALAQAGFADAVAPLGTALTERQIQMLWRMTEKPVICFDGDSAGQKAAMRAAERALPLMQPGYSLQFANMPVGMDPDDIIKAHGAKFIGNLIDGADSLADYIWRFEHGKLLANTKPGPDDRAVLKSNLEKIAQAIGHRDVAFAYKKYLVGKFFDHYGFDKGRMKRYANVVNQAIVAAMDGRNDLIMRAILLGLSRYPESIKSEIENIAALPISCDVLEKMRSLLIEFAVEQPEIKEDMIEQMWAQELLSDFEPRNLSRDLAFSFYFKHEDSRRPRNDLRLVIRFVLEDTKISKEISRAAEAVNLDMNDENYARFKEAENRRRDLANWLREEMDRRQSEAESTESQEFA